MRVYIMRRCLQAIIVMQIVLFIVFLMLYLTGDPAALLMPIDAAQEDLDQFRKMMGFDKPFHVQYYRFLFGHGRTHGVLRGDFGFSFRHELPAMALVLQHFPATLQLAFASLFIALIIGIPTGLLSATFRGTWIDHVSTVGGTIGQSMPDFWLGLMLIILFAARLRWLPTSGYEGPEYIILPAFTAGTYATARFMRLMRSGMLEVLRMDYIRTARSKGVDETRVVLYHSLKNASIPAVTLVGLELGILLGGTVVIETVFAWPGVGFLVVDAINHLDYPVVQAAVTLLAFLFVLVNLVVDILYAWLDPRISYANA